ncbi:MAG: DNA photolyase family protein [Sphingomonas bacterium]|nr:DNA photolyase family protein [Sphingomonas bacterium]
MTAPTIVWLRRDLRLVDPAALRAAAGEGPVVPVYILDDETSKHRKMGAASRWWLHHSVASLGEALDAKGSRLILRKGRSDEVLVELAQEIGASRVHALRHYEPWWRNAERAVADWLDLILHDGNYLAPPGSVTTGAGQPYKIFTPFWRALRDRLPPAEPLPPPDRLDAPDKWPQSDVLDDWALLPSNPDWATGFVEEWTPGEKGAADRLDNFVAIAPQYEGQRNLPSIEGSSRLSPHLHFGEISPAAVWHSMADAGGSVETYLSELGWRDYAQNVILQLPDYNRANGRPQLDAIRWRDAPADLAAWQEGLTGYPIVDAGMRQLRVSGWMHNRVRMIAASFLVKHLLIDWRTGEQWFWDCLVDADYGSNATNWQWITGSGIDANMFIRIMAPLVQSEKFDAADYIRRWVPELAQFDDIEIHDPFDDRRGAYPVKIIEHREARERALAALASTR